MQSALEGKVLVQIEEKRFFAGAEAGFAEFVLEGGDPVGMIQQIAFILEPSDGGDGADSVCGREFGGRPIIGESRHDDGNGGLCAIAKTDSGEFDGLPRDESCCELKENECGAEQEYVEPRGECDNRRRDAAREAESRRKTIGAGTGEPQICVGAGEIRDRGDWPVLLSVGLISG